MWETVLFVLLGVVISGIVGAVYHWVVGPGERREGAEDAEGKARAKAEGLEQGAKATEKMADEQVKQIDARAAEQKKLDPVDFANVIIKNRNKS